MAKTATKANATKPATELNLSNSDIELLTAIDTATQAGNIRYISAAEGQHLVAAGLVTVNPSVRDANNNVASQLTDAGKQKVNTMAQAPAAAATAAPTPATGVTFKIATVTPPEVTRASGGGRKTQYPVAELQIGQALFIPAARDADPKKVSKSYGSMVSDYNRKFNGTEGNEVRYFTSRGLADGKAAGFGDEFDGIPGTGIYRLDPANKPAPQVRKPRTKKEAAPADGAQAPVDGAAAAAQAPTE